MSTVLIMDPDPAVGELLQAVLANAGHRPVFAPTTPLALDCLRRERVDIIVTELTDKPGLDGAWEPVTTLRDRAPSTPIVVFTSHQADKMTPRIERGMDVTLIKPFDLEELVRCVEEMTNETQRGKFS